MCSLCARAAFVRISLCVCARVMYVCLEGGGAYVYVRACVSARARGVCVCVCVCEGECV